MTDETRGKQLENDRRNHINITNNFSKTILWNNKVTMQEQ